MADNTPIARHFPRLVSWLAALLLIAAAGCADQADPRLQSLRERGIHFTLDEQGQVDGLYLYGDEEHPIEDADVAIVENFPDIRLLLIESRQVTDAALQYVKPLQNLEELDLAFCRGEVTEAGKPQGGITDAGLEVLAEMPQLKRIGLQATRVTDAAADRLQQALPGCEIDFNYADRIVATMWQFDGDVVEALEQMGAQVERNDEGQPVEMRFVTTDLVLQHIGQLDTLESLTLGGNFTSAGLKHLENLPQLAALDISDPYGQRTLDDNMLETITSLSNLTSLKLNRNKLTDQQLLTLEKLEKLETLEVIGCPVNDDALEKLKTALPDCRITHSLDPLLVELLNNGDDLPAAVEETAETIERDDEGRIVAVEYRLSRISDKGLDELNRLTELRRLELVYCRNLSDSAMDHLQPLSHLKSLTVSHTRIGNVGVAKIARLEGLERLDLSTNRVGSRNSRPIDDAAMLDVGRLQSLTELSVRGTEITDKGLRRLEDLTNLTSLDVRGTHVTEEGVERLKDRLPDCQVLF